MKPILIKTGPFNYYLIETFTNTPIDILAEFLVGDALQVINYADLNYENTFFIKWLKDKDLDNDCASGDTMSMIKKDGRIYVDSQFRDNTDDWSEAFSTTPGNMVKILMQWYEIAAMNPRPNEVLLIQEGDVVSLVPKFESLVTSYMVPVAVTG